MSRLGPYIARFTRFQRDARVYLLTTFVSGISLGLFWINFNLFLAALGLDPPTIGLIATAGSIAGVVISFPASVVSDRFGRRAAMVLSGVLVNIALAGLLFGSEAWHFFLLSALYGAGTQAFFVVQAPFLTEHSTEDDRSELFAAQYAMGTGTNILAAVMGSAIAAWLASTAHVGAESVEAHRVLIAVQLVLMLAALGTVLLLSEDRPGRRGARATADRARASARGSAEPIPPPATEPDPPTTAAGAPASARAGLLARFGIVVEDRSTFYRLVLPSFLITIGAGQLIPFLNLFVQRKFGLDLASVNGVFAFMSLGTVVAILAQPLLARRFGKVASVVIVQGASIPFLVVLGFSPILWTVVVAMAVRNSLMNAGNPMFTAFAMEQVPPAARATLSATLSLVFSLGWALGGPWYSLLQARLGFEDGYAVNFLTIIALYSLSTVLFWRWFGRAEAQPIAPVPAAPRAVPATDDP